VICADANEPGLLCAFIDEKLSARIAGSIAEIDRAHGHERFRGNDGKPVSWAVSIKTPLKDALINRFEVIDDISAYDQWIAALEEAAAFLRSEKAQFENEIATATCSGCGHALAAHLHTRSAELDCHAIGGMPIGGSERKLGKFRKGQMAVVMTLVIATLVGVMSLGADVGVMYYNWVQLQKGADAAAVAGASYLNEGAAGVTLAAADVNANCTGQSDDAKKAACPYAINNGLATDANSLTINEPGQNLPAGASSPNIQVIATRNNLPYVFGRAIGLSTYKVAAMATAAQASAGGGHIFPVGLQCTPSGNPLSCPDPFGKYQNLTLTEKCFVSRSLSVHPLK
jgi:hypothetical protein